MQRGLLTVKLHELEQQYGKLQNRMRIYQRENLEDIKKEIGVIQRETEEQTALMYQNIITAKSKAVTALANAQYSYDEDIEVILKKILPESMHGSGSIEEEREEAKILYAEFSIDFAIQAVRNALCATLTAEEACLERECSEWRNENERS